MTRSIEMNSTLQEIDVKDTGLPGLPDCQGLTFHFHKHIDNKERQIVGSSGGRSQGVVLVALRRS